MNSELQVFLWFAIGAACLLSGNTLRNKYRRLAQNGKTAQGIVTSVMDDSWFKIFGEQGFYHHSIRFVTADQRWISKSYTNLIDNIQSRYREGETINILYNAADPEEFIVGSSASNLKPIILMLIGFSIIGYSIWLVFQ